LIDSWNAKKKILIVDDQVLNLDVLQTLLDDEYDSRFAIDGEVALKLIATGFRPDIILLDIMMPGIDGYTVCRRLKMDDTTKDIPIIFMTSLDSEEDEAKGLDLGAADFITKPFKPALLKARLKTHLQLKMKRDELLSLIGQKNKELEQSLAQVVEKEAYLQSIFKSAPVGIGLTVNRRFKWINQQFEDMLGYSNAELLDRESRILYMNAQEYERVGQVKYEQISQYGTGSADTELVAKDGSVIDVVIKSTPLDESDWSAGVIFTVLDISDRVKQQRELSQSEQRLKQAQKIAKIGCWEYDIKADSLLWSDEVYRVFAVDQERFSPSLETFVNLIHPDDRETVSRSYQDSLAKKESYDIVHRLLLDNGAVKYVHEKCDTQYDDQGQPIISRGTVQDITEQKQLQKEAEQSSRLASLGELAAGIAHEINNPNALTLYNSDILDHIFKDLHPHLVNHRPNDCEQLFGGLSYQDAIGEIGVLFPAIQDSAQRIKRIVNDLRDFARQDSSDMKESVNLNDVVQSSIRLVNNAIKNATDSFELELAQDLPLVPAIKGRLEQVVVNLLVNACQALDSREQKIIVKTLHNAAIDKVKIIVEDEGCGISDAMKGQVFEPFVTSKRDQGGTGLGLSVSARIVKEHQGDLDLQSSPGQGTTVTLSLAAPQ